jgi:hypothetical protein
MVYGHNGSLFLKVWAESLKLCNAIRNCMNKTEYITIYNEKYLSTVTVFLLVSLVCFFSSALQPVLAQEAPAIGDKIVQQGTVSSDVDPLKGHEGHQAAVILPPRNDSALYAGTLTFTASKPVQVAVINMYNIDNATSSQAAERFGTLLTAQAPWNTSATVTPLMMNIDYLDSPTMSKMIPFVGNLVALHTMDGEPFIANYAVVTDVLQPKTINNLASAMGNISTSQ